MGEVDGPLEPSDGMMASARIWADDRFARSQSGEMAETTRELFMAGARIFDERRQVLQDRIEAAGGVAEWNVGASNGRSLNEAVLEDGSTIRLSDLLLTGTERVGADTNTDLGSFGQPLQLDHTFGLNFSWFTDQNRTVDRLKGEIDSAYFVEDSNILKDLLTNNSLYPGGIRGTELLVATIEGTPTSKDEARQYYSLFQPHGGAMTVEVPPEVMQSENPAVAFWDTDKKFNQGYNPVFVHTTISEGADGMPKGNSGSMNSRGEFEGKAAEVYSSLNRFSELMTFFEERVMEEVEIEAVANDENPLISQERLSPDPTEGESAISPFGPAGREHWRATRTED